MKIPVYTPQVTPGDAGFAPRIQPREQISGEGGALRNVGSAVDRLGTGIEAQQSLSDALQRQTEQSQFSSDFEQGRAFWAKRLDDAESSPDGTTGLFNQVQDDYKQWREKHLSNIVNPAVKLAAQKQLDSFGAVLAEKALGVESKNRVSGMMDNETKASDSAAQAVYTDPTQYAQALNDRLSTLDTAAIPPINKARLRDYTQQHLAKSAVLGRLKTPADAQSFLESVVPERYAPGVLAPEQAPAWVPDGPGTGSMPLGVKNNNPGNIRAGVDQWQGMTGTDTHGFVQFATPEAGFRALAKNLVSYQDKHGLTTVAGIVSRWAPPSENNTAAYITAVSNDLGVKPDAPLDLHDAGTLTKLSQSITKHEQGKTPYTPDQVTSGVNAALGGVKVADSGQIASDVSTFPYNPGGSPAYRERTSIPEFDALPPAEKVQMIHAATTLAHQGQADARAQLEQVTRDATAAARNGERYPNAPGLSAFRQAWGTASGDEKFAEFEATQQMADTRKAFVGMSSDDIQRSIDSTHVPAGPGAAAGQQRQQFLAQAANAILKEREDDAAGYAARYSPIVKSAYDGIFGPGANGKPIWVDPSVPAADKQAAMAKYLATSVQEQQRLGISKQAYLPAPIADYIVQGAQYAAGSGDKMAQHVVAMEQTFGDRWPDIYKELAGDGKRRPQIPDSFIVIPALNSAAAREEVARLDPIKTTDLEKQVATGDTKDIKDKLQQALAPWAESLMASQTNVAAYTAVENVALKMALSRRAKGMSVGDAVQQAASTITGQYEFPNAGSKFRYAVPTSENPELVKQGVQLANGKIGMWNVATPPDLTGARKPAEAQQEWQSILSANPLWVTNGNETGLQLYGAGADGRPRPALWPNGKPIEFSYSDLRSFAQDANARVANPTPAPNQPAPTSRTLLERQHKALEQGVRR